MLEEQTKWRVFPTVVTYLRKHLRKWLKPRLQKRQVGTHLRMIRARTNLQILNYEMLYLIQRGLRKVDTAMEPKKKGDLAKQVCALLTKDEDAGPYTPIKPRRSPCRTPPASVGSMASGHPGPSSMAGPSGPRKSASKALSADFGDDHAIANLRTRVASRKEKAKEKKQVAEGANKSQSTQGWSSKEAKKAIATIDEEGRGLTRLIDRALHGMSGEMKVVTEPKAADCPALRPLAAKIAKVYQPCALVVKKTELMKGWLIPMA